MTHLIVFGLFGLASLLQSAALPAPTLAQAQPNLVLILVAGWGVARGAHQGVAWALAGGLILGLSSIAPLGSIALALIPVALLTNFSQLRLVADERLLVLGIVFLGTLLYGGVLITIFQTLGYPVDWWQDYRYLFFPGALLNAMLAALIYPFFPWLASRLFPSRTP